MEGGSNTSAANQENNGEYMAPYHRLPEDESQELTDGGDIIYFRKGHTLEKHSEAMGEPLIHGRYQRRLFQRSLNVDELRRTRRDPGVEKVVQVSHEMEKEITKQDRTLVTFPGADVAPGYFVVFLESSYTVEQHFARIGERFEEVRVFNHTGYFVDGIPEAKLDRIFADPNVWSIEQNTYAEFC